MSRPLSAVDCIAPAFAQTKKQLFQPFRWGRWARLALISLIAGESAGGGGGVPSGHFNIPISHPRDGRTPLAIPNIQWGEVLHYLPWIVAGVALILLLILLWIYAASVFRFVLFDSVLHDRCQFKGSWTRWEPCGRSYFLWSLAFFVVVMIGFALLIGAPLVIAWRAGLFHHPNEHIGALILGGAALLVGLIVYTVLSGITGLFAKDFCVPIMATENVGVLDAWRRLLPLLAAEMMGFAGYVLMKIVLAIGAAIIFGIITLLTLVALLISLGIAGVIVFFGGKASGLTLNVATISILIALGAIILAGLIYLAALINTPAIVFFQSYVLHFIGARYEGVGCVLFPPPPGTPPPSGAQIPPAPGGLPVIEPSIG